MRRVGLGFVALAAAAGVVVAVNAPAGAAKPLSKAALHNAAGEQIGIVVFKGYEHEASRVKVELELPADAPGLGAYHGLHVHTVGVCEAPFTSAGGHWSRDADSAHGHHTGDLPSVLVAEDGTASAEFDTQRFDVAELLDEDGSAVVLHAGLDNFGNVPLEEGKYEDPNN
ncbi:MAG: superoxide dismutase [Actinophytocola sp.]|nr:superoxide dismutase [Actinophytocola sp.]